MAMEIMKGRSTPKERTGNIPHDVYQQIRGMIISGDLEAGSRIKQVHVAKTLNVSQTPVREAIRMLEQDGWLVNDFHKGCIVKEITLRDIIDAYEVREVIEGMLARKATSVLTDDQVAELEKLAKQADLDFVNKYTDNAESYDKEDLDFHTTLAEYVGNRQVIDLFKRLRNLEFLMIKRSENFMKQKAATGINQDKASQHFNIVRAIASKDAEWAEALARWHIRMVIKELLESLDYTVDRLTSNGKHYTVNISRND